MATTRTPHTPGPWRTGHGREAHHIYDQQGRLISIARYINGSEDIDFVEANARLIAASPKLLEAAQEAVGQLEMAYMADSGEFGLDGQHLADVAEAVGILRTAIARATGATPAS